MENSALVCFFRIAQIGTCGKIKTVKSETVKL